MVRSISAFLLLLFLLFAADITAKDTPIELVYKNRSHLSDILHHLNYGMSLSDTSTITHRYYSTLYLPTILDSAFSCWKKNEEKILNEFLISYAKKANLYKKHCFYIEDSITVSTLISFLDYPDYRVRPKPKTTAEEFAYMAKPKPNWVRDALELLTYRVYFSSIRKQSSEIIDRLSRCGEPGVDKLMLLVLCDLPQNVVKTKRDSLMNHDRYLDSLLNSVMKNYTIPKENLGSVINRLHLDSLLKEESSMEKTRIEDYGDTVEFIVGNIKRIQKKAPPLWVNALLGDTTAEKKIVLNLNHNYLYYMKDASFVWSKPCKDAFFTLFEKDYPQCNGGGGPYSNYPDNYYVNTKDYVVCRSILDSLLIYLARHHPGEPIFQNKLSSIWYNADFCKPEEQIPYFRDFSKWAKEHYGIDITYKDFIPYFKKAIGDKSKIQNICKHVK